MNYKKVAIVHDWLTGMRGGEYVLEALCELFPEAELYTLVSFSNEISETIKKHKIHTSFFQKIPGIQKYYRHFLPLMPLAVGFWRFDQYDLIISSSHCVAKGIKKGSNSFHISYIHAPMRYIWDRFDDYFGKERASWFVRIAAQLMRPFLKRWDKKVSQKNRIDHLISNSRFIASQVKKHYGRESDVIYPFADTVRFNSPRDVKSFYFMVGAFAPNKRVDIAVEAFNDLGLDLWVGGDGQEKEKIQKIARPNIKFLGKLSNQEIAVYYSKAKVFIFPGLEDAGITPMEAMSAGCPVICFGEGGATETVIDGVNGIHFKPQTKESLKEAVLKIENGNLKFNEADCRARGQIFSRERFKKEFLDILKKSTQSKSF